MTMSHAVAAPASPSRRRPGAAEAPARQPSPGPRPAGAPTKRAALPAALRWEDASLPLLGRVRAAGWLPTILLAVLAVLLMYLLQTGGVANTGYDIQRLEADRSEWELRNEQLKLELAKLRSLPWVEAEATSRLGMRRAEKTVFITVDRSTAP